MNMSRRHGSSGLSCGGSEGLSVFRSSFLASAPTPRSLSRPFFVSVFSPWGGIESLYGCTQYPRRSNSSRVYISGPVPVSYPSAHRDPGRLPRYLGPQVSRSRFSCNRGGNEGPTVLGALRAPLNAGCRGYPKHGLWRYDTRSQLLRCTHTLPSPSPLSCVSAPSVWMAARLREIQGGRGRRTGTGVGAQKTHCAPAATSRLLLSVYSAAWETGRMQRWR
ncbi:hypothetical protein B0H14DRAFT_542669 [Mycena olivaceomarginata]|nr:hypothetical protein B0H14DRAFT_542669 [Mycena olivaceomarginata]